MNITLQLTVILSKTSLWEAHRQSQAQILSLRRLLRRLSHLLRLRRHLHPPLCRSNTYLNKHGYSDVTRTSARDSDCCNAHCCRDYRMLATVLQKASAEQRINLNILKQGSTSSFSLYKREGVVSSHSREKRLSCERLQYSFKLLIL